jgi:glycosyltransferase involved in cell wall biosynthesis
VSGRLVPPADPAALAAAVQELLDRPAEAARLARNGRRVIEERFDQDAAAGHLADLLRAGG